VTRTCGEEAAGRAQAPVVGAALVEADGLAVAVVDGLAVVAAGAGALVAVLALGVPDGDADDPAGSVSRHCWFVWPLHRQWMTAAPFAADRPDTSTHRPFCTFLSA
jgi:hypothetical protein